MATGERGRGLYRGEKREGRELWLAREASPLSRWDLGLGRGWRRPYPPIKYARKCAPVHGALGAAGSVFLTGNKKKMEVTEKRVYRIYRKILGFTVLFSDEI